MSRRRVRTTVFGLVLWMTVGCQEGERPRESTAGVEGQVLFRVGSMAVYESDLDHCITQDHAGRQDEATRQRALDSLAQRARLAQAALDAGLGETPEVRAQIASVLASSYRERTLFAQLERRLKAIDDKRLREVYASAGDRFISEEKRRLAVLWLNPGKDPGRVEAYQEKLGSAREWLLGEGQTVKPADGFSVLSVDHSEHAATRFKGGVLGWFEREQSANDWERVVIEQAFRLEVVGEVSPVVTSPEGIFLVRLMELIPAQQRPFESVRAQLEQEERRRVRDEMESAFMKQLEAAYPIIR